MFFFLVGCEAENAVNIAEFTSIDLANKSLVLLENNKINSKIIANKDSYFISVKKEKEKQSIAILTRYNFYFKKESLNNLIESKFASLSKLENIKSNLLRGRELYNKLSIIPNIFRVSVIVNGDENKNISVLIISLSNLEFDKKNNIEKFIKGMINESDSLSISYFVES